LRTCKQIFNEAMPLLYRDKEFHLYLAAVFTPRLSDFLLFIGPRQAEWIRRIVMAPGTFYPVLPRYSDMPASVRADLVHFARSTNISRLRFCFLDDRSDLLLQWESQIFEGFFGGSDDHLQDRIREATIEPRVNDWINEYPWLRTYTLIR
jgi:hypothetical protein